jgi:hypothetical protein
VRPANRVIVFVWDGLRPDSINERDTPRLADIAARGAFFPDNHATYPTFTMINSSTFATGSLVAKAGFYGNWLWQPLATKKSPSGAPLASGEPFAVRYAQPFFTEDYTALRDLDDFYDGALLEEGSLFEAAAASGLTTVALGKTGAAYLQDRHRRGIVIDERAVWPLAVARELQQAGVRLPKGTALAYPEGDVTLDAEKNGDPTAVPPSRKLSDGSTTDPRAGGAAPATDSNAYLMSVYLDHVLPQKKPDLTVIWNRNPDTAEHWYGPGTEGVKLALQELDGLLGKLVDRLTALGLMETTNLVVVSDHGHSTVSGPLATFPLRSVEGEGEGRGRVGRRDPSGFSVSGDVRLADLLTRVGKFHAYDGLGCLHHPVLSGIKIDGKPLYPERTDDAAGTICGKDVKTGRGKARFTTPAYRLPAPLPADAVVIAVNGGSDYVYVPSHAPELLERVVRFLQARPEVGALFVSARYPSIPGTLPMESVRMESKDPRRNPDLVMSYDYDEHAVVSGMPGIIYAGAQNYRGMHGTFSPVDVHNSLVAIGPDFRGRFRDPLPTGNVDVPPTLAKILGVSLPRADGRVLDEALTRADVPATAYTVETPEPLVSSIATGLKVLLPTDTDGTRIDPSKTKYRATLRTRRVSRDGASWTYFDSAKATRD